MNDGQRGGSEFPKEVEQFYLSFAERNTGTLRNVFFFGMGIRGSKGVNTQIIL